MTPCDQCGDECPDPVIWFCYDCGVDFDTPDCAEEHADETGHHVEAGNDNEDEG